MKIFFGLCFTFALFYFSEGKSCPEEYRPHKTRCDAYFKCIILKTKNHVWIPEKCDRGLIFEKNLKICVLPDDDWECQLNDDIKTNNINNNNNNDENNIYGINSLEISENISIDKNVESLKKNNIENEIDNIESEINNNNNKKITEFIEVKSDDNNNNILTVDNSNSNIIDIDFIHNSDIESSGDGFIDDTSSQLLESKESTLNSPIITDNIENVDPNLTNHLQRLTQLIDGLKSTYQNKDSFDTELRPDQLNAFLAHYNIKSGFDAIKPNNIRPLQENLQNGDMDINIVNQIVEKQKNLTNNSINKDDNNNNSVKNNLNSVNKIKQNPETKVIIKNSKRYRNPQGQYSNSQIVVNRPEGSVVFSLPLKQPEYNYNKHSNDESNYQDNYNKKHNIYEYDSDPRITADTLKTVLELSKQMMENQNIRQILPNNGYYQPIIQPMYYPFPIPSFSNKNNLNSNNNLYDSNVDLYDSNVNSENLYEKPSLSNNQKSPTTIIHNNVIPVQVTANSEKGIIQRPSIDTKSSSSLNDKTATDSYGNKISEYIDYPPFLQPPVIEYPQKNSQTFYNEPISKPSSYNDIIMTTEKYNKISNYYTPNPHLDNSNANSLFNIERYPTVSSYDRLTQYDQQQQINNPNKYIYNLFDKQQSIQQNQNYNNKIPSIMQMQNLNKFNSNNIDQQQQSEEFEDNFKQNYHQNNINQIVTNSLTPKLEQIFYGQQQQQQQQSNIQQNDQLINLGGSFINYDIYKNQILPALNNNLGGSNEHTHGSNLNIEIVTCTIGVRQANISDCTKYYVCSKKDSKILTYSCPPYTGFNSQTRICDAQTYAFCNPQAVLSRYTVTENRKIQLEALKALQDAKRIRDEAIQAQNLANLIRFETQKVINSTYTNSNTNIGYTGQNELNLFNLNNQPIQQQQQEQPLLYNNYQMEQMLTTRKPFIISAGHKRRKYYCREGDKVADQTSVLSYFVCYKTKDGIMKGHKMTCSPGLIFCSQLKLCTLPKNCNVS